MRIRHRIVASVSLAVAPTLLAHWLITTFSKSYDSVNNVRRLGLLLLMPFGHLLALLSDDRPGRLWNLAFYTQFPLYALVIGLASQPRDVCFRSRCVIWVHMAVVIFCAWRMLVSYQ